MKEVVGMKPIYYFYLGSITIPPCDEYAYHLIIGKPIRISDCQFKILRENSLADNESRQIHSRLTQINNPDDYDDGTSDEGDVSDGTDGSSSSGRSGAGNKGKGGVVGLQSDPNDIVDDDDPNSKGKGKFGIMALHNIIHDPDLDNLIDDDDLRRLFGLKKRLDGKKNGDDDDNLNDGDDPLNC